MFTLVTVNMEGGRHYDRIIGFLTTTKPHSICLQEMPAAFIPHLESLGYTVIFAPMTISAPVAPNDSLGLGLATRSVPHATNITYYAGSQSLTTYLPSTPRDSIQYPVITAQFEYNTTPYTLATVHHPVTANGYADQFQTAATTALLAYLTTLPPHLLCGDFNMPRGYNTNYEQFTAHYTDTIPHSYASSLDRSLHRDGQRTDLNAPIFDRYMVDYIFSQPPYLVQDVTLHFGVSDHAAVKGTIKHL